jgi:excisionase family DNA binding protein
VGEDRTEPHSAGSASGSVSDTLTISEAATFLGVHKNTVRNRIKDGTYEAEQVVTERGPTYFIKRESILNTLTTNTLSSPSQEHGTAIVNPQSLAFVQELLRPFVNEVGQVREELGAERARRQIAEERVAELEEEIEALKSQPSPAEAEAQEPSESPESPGPTRTPTHAGGGAQTPPGTPERDDEVDNRGWFKRFFGIGE